MNNDKDKEKDNYNFSVKDSQRILKFNGKLLGFSTSKRPDSFRWIEFYLYLTESNKYILSRIGRSNLYHCIDCSIAEKSKLDESPRTEVESTDYPCQECRPDLENVPLVSFEREKHWARVYSTPEEVIDGLLKTDETSKERYMTAVARRLLEEASAQDDVLFDARNVEVIL